MKTTENLEVMFDRFESFIKNETIVGKEIKIGDVSIIPLASISFGLGTGAGGNPTEGEAGGSGIFAKATPTAILVVNGAETNLIPIRKGSSFDSLLQSVPALVEKLSDQMGKKKDEKKETSEEAVVTEE